jgi:excisionase family DNA binding protein
MEFLTTSEAAEYVRLGERKLYELVTSGEIPCSKVTGKWLFPRQELDLWVLSGLARPGGMIAADPPPIVGGSQDDLLEWTLRESGSGLASLAEGTARGVERLLRGEVIAAAVHFHSDSANKADANIAAGAARYRWPPCWSGWRGAGGPAAAVRQPEALHSLADVLEFGRAMAVRQQGAGRRCLKVPADARRRQTPGLRRLELPVSRGPTLRPRSAPARPTAASPPAPPRNRRGSILSRCFGRILTC